MGDCTDCIAGKYVETMGSDEETDCATINAVRKSVTADITHVRTRRARQACRWRHGTR
eukprot:COSAG04_NODE_32797_length_195_cov_173.177083_1_plen_57_part_01